MSSRDRDEAPERDWGENLAYGGDSEAAVPEHGTESDHWDRWHYGVYLGAALLLLGAFEASLVLLLSGYLLAPVAIYLDSRYLDSITPNWRPDTGLHLLGTLLFPFLMIPAYLYRRREL